MNPRKMKRRKLKRPALSAVPYRLVPCMLVLGSFFLYACGSQTVRAEEYYALGTAYFDLKKYDEAERWFDRAKFHLRTRDAAEYNLGRIAYERGKYEEAARWFDRILNRDPENITALKAAAYTSIKTGDREKAAGLYDRVLALVPESYDDGYNYALVLLAMERAEEAEAVLARYNNTESPEALFLLARAQKKQEKPEAAEAFTASLAKKDDPHVRLEYAEFLGVRGLYAKAVDEYKKVLDAPGDLARADVKFGLASAMIRGNVPEGAAMLKEALAEGFNDQTALDALIEDDAVPAAKKEELRKIRAEANP